MTFVSGQKIQSSDYNTLVNDLNDVYAVGTGDSGYGATALLTVDSPPPFILVDNQHWLELRDAIELMGDHQGSVPTLPDIIDLEDGDDIQAFASFVPAISTVTTNKLNVDAGSTAVDNSVLSNQRVTDWSTQIKHVFTVDFEPENPEPGEGDDAARHFFNTGGQIRITMTGPTGDASHNWGSIYSAAGTFIFDLDNYYNLSPTINNSVTFLIFNTSGGVYSIYTQPNVWSITARYIAGSSANGARGSKIEISSVSTDVYSGNPSFPGSPDNVAATTPFISTIDERRSVTFFSRPPPTYATVVSLADGI